MPPSPLEDTGSTVRMSIEGSIPSKLKIFSSGKKFAIVVTGVIEKLEAEYPFKDLSNIRLSI